MFRVLVLLMACALALSEPVSRLHMNKHEERQDPHRREYRLVDPSKGQQPHAHDPHIQRENEIINDVLGPVYYQPQILIDYRYLRTHRSFVEGPGGQDLILPKSVHDPHHPFDHLLEELRRKELVKEGHKELSKEKEESPKPRDQWRSYRERNEWKYE